mmetsp:Transcript_38547/g.61590  ORF Transcript_38547/g.61590 Transcript_38547/m.61590 type:complete len:330 (-) Transcript_38547:170-1159(-)
MALSGVTTDASWGVMLFLMSLNFIACIAAMIITALSRAYHKRELTETYGSDLSDRQHLLAYLIYAMSALCAVQCVLCHFSGAYQENAADFFCSVIVPVCFVLYYAAKAALYGFFLERAKLAQGISNLFPEYLFKYILPIYILLYFVVASTLVLITIRAQRVYSDPVTKSCVISIAVEGIIEFCGALDVVNCVLLLYLFVKPIRVTFRRRKSGSAPEEDLKQFRFMTRLNIVCSLICCISTFVVMFLIPIFTDFTWLAGNLDMSINTMAVFFMMGSNRKYLSVKCARVCECCQERMKQERTQSISAELGSPPSSPRTDAATRTNTETSHE